MPSRILQRTLLTLALLATTLPTFFCNNAEKEDHEVQQTSQWRNVYDTSAHYVGMQTCRTCHESVYQTFIQTGMGQSFGHATKEKSAADFSPGHALVYDSALDYYYKPYWYNDSFYIMEFRLDGKDTVHKRIQKVNYVVGSGTTYQLAHLQHQWLFIPGTYHFLHAKRPLGPRTGL